MQTAARLRSFGTSIFTTMTRLAVEHDAINLSQGFPDFDGPEWLREAAVKAIREGPNQYAPSPGNPRLRQGLAAKAQRDYDLRYDAESEITVLGGATEGIAAVLLGILDAGDEVVILEPFYDSYPACVSMAGGSSVFVPLHAPAFCLDVDAVERAITPRTRIMILNSPCNPIGKVFSRAELESLAQMLRRHPHVLVMTDEVYEHIVFPPHEHIPFATLAGMWERTLVVSSFSKTLSMTGWKVGYVYAPAELTAAVRAAHQFLTFCAPSPLQNALADVIELLPPYLRELRADYLQRRDFWLACLERAGLSSPVPGGTYFAVSDVRGLGCADDVEFCRTLTREHKLAAIPASCFYSHKEVGAGLVRWAFCKNLQTLEAAGERLMGWKKHGK